MADEDKAVPRRPPTRPAASCHARAQGGKYSFRKIFKRTVETSLKAKIATAEVVHIDASLIRANVSWDSLVERHVGDALKENPSDADVEAEKKERQSGKYKKVCVTDPDATMATNARNRRLEQRSVAWDFRLIFAPRGLR